MGDDEELLLDLCARFFREPERLAQAARIRVASALNLPEHRHRDLWQLDVADGLAGGWRVNGCEMALHGVTAAVFYPGDEHGYALRAPRPGGCLFSLKLRAGRNWPALRRRVLPALVHSVTGAEALIRALRRLTRLTAASGARAPLLIATLAEVLCRWPEAPARGRTASSALGNADDARLERALLLLEERLADPPSLDELAAAAHLSPRHFTRRFRALCGETPHAYLAARRLARAQELLVQEELNVTQIAEALGFPSIHTFSRWFRRHTRTTPTGFRERPTLL